jgi:hypothetical protein
MMAVTLAPNGGGLEINMIEGPKLLAPPPPPPPSVRRTLAEVEECLKALEDTAELVVAEQELEFLADLEDATVEARAKRDRVGSFIAQCEGQAATADKEIKRLQRRKAAFEALVERMEAHVAHIVMRNLPDRKGRYPKLEGHTSSFRVQRNAPTVLVTDEAAVPTSCKTVTITLPATMWDNVCGSLDLDLVTQVLAVVTKPDSAVVKASVKAAIEAAVPDWQEQLKERPSVFDPSVPGAAIAAGTWRLVRE